ncbi:hypothetical protein FQZ97_1104540 [compost metagenome]
MSEGKAVVMNRHFVMAEPCHRFAHILDRLAHASDYQITWLRKTQRLSQVGIYM